MTPAAVCCTDPRSLLMRTLVLAAYTLVAAWAAYAHVETAWFVLHGTGALAGVCAMSQAVSLAGLRGELQRRLYGPGEPDRAEFEEEW